MYFFARRAGDHGGLAPQRERHGPLGLAVLDPGRFGNGLQRLLVQVQDAVLNISSRSVDVIVHAPKPAWTERRFTDLVVDKTRAWRFGNPADPGVQMGTVIDEAAARRIASRVDEALAQGARLR